MVRSTPGWWAACLLLIAIVLSFLIRIPALLSGLPTYVMPSEYEIVCTAVAIIEGDLLEQWFIYGGLLFYLEAAFVGLVHVVYHLFSFLGGVSDPQTPYWLFYVAGRAMALLAHGTIVTTTYFIAREFSSRYVSLTTALIASLIPILFRESIAITPNLPVIAFAALSILFAVRYMREHATFRELAFSAGFAGLAVGTKFMFLAVVPFITAKAIKLLRKRRFPIDRELLLASGISVGTFLIANPNTLLQPSEFLAGLFSVQHVYTASHHGIANVPSMVAYFGKELFLRDITWLSFPAGLLGVVLGWKKSWDKILVIFLGPVLWALLMSLYGPKVTYNVAILAVPLSVSAGLVLQRIGARWIVLLLVGGMCIPAAQKDLSLVAYRTKPDIRYRAADWIQRELPEGSVVAREDYTPLISNTKYHVRYIGISGLERMSPDSVLKAGIDYVVMADTYDQFKKRPTVYADEIARYEAHLQRFPVIRSFHPGTKYSGPTIRVLHVKLPFNHQCSETPSEHALTPDS